MNAEKEIVCGADIHRDFLVATMISRSGLKLQEQFAKAISKTKKSSKPKRLFLRVFQGAERRMLLPSHLPERCCALSIICL
jgi:hypothetical protein